MLRHFVGSTTLFTGHYSRGTSHFARPFGCIAQKFTNDHLLFCALELPLGFFTMCMFTRCTYFLYTWHLHSLTNFNILTLALHSLTRSFFPQATGTRLGTVIETMIGMLFAIVIAFAYTWVLSLVILGMVPIVLVAGALEVKALSGHTLRNKKALETAGKVMTSSFR